MRLRPIALADRDWIVESHRSVYADEYGFNTRFIDRVIAVVDRFFLAADGVSTTGWLAIHDAERIGSILLYRDAVDTAAARLGLFFLEAGRRGRGYGRHMLETACDHAFTHGYTRLRVATYATHHAACQLYRTAGFDEIERRPVTAYGQSLVECHFLLEPTASQYPGIGSKTGT